MGFGCETCAYYFCECPKEEQDICSNSDCDVCNGCDNCEGFSNYKER